LRIRELNGVTEAIGRASRDRTVWPLITVISDRRAETGFGLLGSYTSREDASSVCSSPLVTGVIV
jgi:hypothetical protein